MIRTIICVPSMKGNDWIQERFAQLNLNLNVGQWVFKARRQVNGRENGRSYKTTLFIRMDEESVDRLKFQDFRVNWIGGTLQVNLENHPKSNAKSEKPAINNSVNKSNPNGISSTEISSAKVSEAHPVEAGLTQIGESATMGNE